MRNKISILMIPAFNVIPVVNMPMADACSQIRMLPHVYNLKENKKLDIDVFSHVQPLEVEYFSRYDIIWANRLSLLNASNFEDIIEYIAGNGLKLVLDLDDAILDIDEQHTEANYYQLMKIKLKKVISICNLVICSTAGVQNSVNEHCPGIKTVIVKNSLPNIDGSIISRKNAHKTKICYYGTNTHLSDWRLIEPVLIDLALENPHIEVELIGVISSNQLSGNPRNIYLRQVPISAKYNYRKFIRFLNDQIQPDIVLAPLEYTKFNKAKSELKALEALKIGAVPIVSKGFEYDQLSQYIDPKWYCSSIKDWYSSIQMAIDGQLNHSISKKNEFQSNYALKRQSTQIGEIMEKLM